MNFKEGCAFSFRSPLVWGIGGICILFWLVASLKEFQYGRILNLTFTDEKDLSRFYGHFTIILRTTVLIFQIFITARIVKLTGVCNGFYLLPVTIFICLSFVFMSFSFYSAVIMRFLWDLVAMTIQLTVFQLSFNAISGPYRGRVRGILEGFINPLGGIAGGTCLILINRIFYNGNDLKDHRIIITIFGLFFALLWIGNVLWTKKKYKNMILQNLSSDDRRTCLDAIEMLGELEKPVAKRKLEELYERGDEKVKEAVMKTGVF